MKPRTLATRKRVIASVVSAMLAPAGVLADGMVAANPATQVTAAPNGVPVVNIAVPNANGLSHNRYTQFNVDHRGAILNNAAGQPFVQTQLAGQILGNVNLPRPASVILNEVVSGNRSTLAGFIEIAGSRADLIVANPNGITCSGCGFINTPRVTMTTGAPMLAAGSDDLLGFRVTSGDVVVNGSGLDARSQDYLDIVARSIVVDGQVNARQLALVAGDNDWDYVNRQATTNAASGSAPTLAIDSTVLGGIYANRIRILATEAGVGVRMLGDAAASADSFSLSASGAIQLRGRVSASQGAVAILHNGPGADGAGAITLDGSSLSASGNVTLDTVQAGAGITLAAGTLTAGGNLSITSAGDVTDSAVASGATRFAAGDLTLAAANAVTLDRTVWGAGGATAMEVGSLQVGAGGATLYSGSNSAAASRALALTAHGGSLALGNASLQSPDAIALAAHTSLTNAGTIAAATALTVDTASVTNSGTLQGSTSLTLTTGTLTNLATGEILTRGQAGASLTIDATDIANAGTVQSAGTLVVTSSGALVNAGTGRLLTQTVALGGSAGNLQLTGASVSNAGTVGSSGTLDLSAGTSLQNLGTLQSVGTTTLMAGTQFSNQAGASVVGGGDVVITSPVTSFTLTNAGRLEAGGALTLGTTGHTANLTNSGVALGNTLAIQAGALTNQGTLQAADGASIAGNTLLNQGQNAVILTSTSGTGAGTVAVVGTVTNEGVVHGNGALAVTAASITNTGTGGMSSLTALTLGSGSGSIDNYGSIYSAVDLTVNGGGFFNHGAAGPGGGEIYAGRDMAFNVAGQTFENSGILNAGRNVTVSARDFRNLPIGGLPTVLVTSLTPVNPDGNGYPTAQEIAYSEFHCNGVGDDCATNRIYQVEYTTTETLQGKMPAPGQIVAGNAFTLNYSNTAINTASVISAPSITINGIGAQAFQNNSFDTYENHYNFRVRVRRNGYGLYAPGNAADYAVLDSDPNDDAYYDNNWTPFSVTNWPVCEIFLGCNLFATPEFWTKVRAGYRSTGVPVLLDSHGAGLFASGPITINGGGVANNGPIQQQVALNRKQGQNANANGSSALNFVNGVAIPGLNLNLPANPNGFFVVARDPNARYLIETNPRFAAGSPFGGSDYLEKLLGFNPDKQLKRLGDDNYEAKLIRDQLLAQTGNVILASFSNEVLQMKGLMESAAAQSGGLGLQFGAPLTEQQVAGLQQDIVWMVEQTVAGQKVLAPVVYLSRRTQNAVATGAVISAQDIVVAGTQLSNMGGTISASRDLRVNVTGDITNVSGSISGANVALTTTGGSIRNETSAILYGDNNVGQTQVGKQGTIEATNNLTLDAARDVVIKGADVTAGNNAAIRAGGDVVIDTVENRTATSSGGSSSSLFNRSGESTNTVTVQQRAANLTVGNGLTVEAGRDITIAGSNVTSGGDAKLDAGGNLNILARTDSVTTTTMTTESGLGVGGGIGGSRMTTTTDTQKTNVASTLSLGGNSQLSAGNTLNVVGSDVAARGNLDLNARDINVVAGENSQETKSRTVTTTLNLTAEANADRVGVGANVKMETTDTYDFASQARGSTLSSGGNLTRNATNTIVDRGTAITAGGSVTQSAASIQSLAAEDKKVSTSSTTTTTIGYGVGVNVGAGQAYEGGKSAVENADPTQIAQPNVNVGVDVTFNRTTTNNASADSRAVVSTIRAGGNIDSTSSGTSVLQGTSVEAGKNVNLKAGDLQVTAARDTHTESSDSNSIDAKVSLTYNGSVGGSVSGGYGTKSSEAASSDAVVANIKSGGNLSIDAARDVRLEGTKLESGGSTSIVGDTVNFEAAKSTASSSSNSMDVSASISLSKGTGKSSGDKGGGVEASYSESSDRSNATTSAAGSVAAGGNVTVRARAGDVKLEGTDLSAGKDITLAAQRNVEFSAATDTASSNSSSMSISGSLSGGKSSNEDGSKNKSVSGGGQFASGSSSSESVTRRGGSATAGGTLSVQSGGNTRLEGTQVAAAAAKVDVGGNLTMESAVSTSSSKSSNVGVGLSVSSDSPARQKPGIKPPKKEGPVSAYGSADIGSSSRDTRTNQNTSIQVGKLDAKVAGNARLAGAEVKASQQNVGVKGTTTVEKRTDMDSGSSSSIKLRAGVVSKPGSDDKTPGGAKKGAKDATKLASAKTPAKTSRKSVAKTPAATKPSSLTPATTPAATQP